MKYSLTFAALAAAVPVAVAQVAAYGQCGGKNYSGATECASGYYCNAYNDFYSQCVEGTASSSDSQSATSAVSSVATSESATAASSDSTVAASSASSVATTSCAATIYTTVTASVQPASSNATSAIPTTAAHIASSSSVSSGAVSSSAVVFSSSTLVASVQSTSSAVVVSTSSTATTSSTAASTSVTTSTNSTSSSSNPSTSGTQFVIDGETGYFAGTNSYWIGFLTNNSDVDLVMQHLSESGLKILRVWGFNDVTATPSTGTVYFQSFAGSEPVINTGADGLERLDYVVKSAEAHGIKLIINFVNNWTDYGGMAAYFTYAGITDNTQWYNSTLAQTQYQKYIKTVVSRYTNSSAIFAWELANEPRCTGCDLSIMTTWITNTATYIKTLDPGHMVTTGEEGFGLSTGDDGTYPYTTGAGGYNFTANCAIDEIDFCTYHLYPESWSVTPTQEWGNEWITNHAAACAAVGKPCLLEEFGASNNCTIESDWQATALKATGTGADLFWQYGDTLSSGQTAQDGNTAFYGDDLYTCLVTNHIAAIDAL